MSFAYVDTSALVAIAYAEPGYLPVARLLDSKERLFSVSFLEAEFRAAFRRENMPFSGGHLVAPLTFVYPRHPLTEELERVFGAGRVRGADAWHLACALFLDPEASNLAFVTLDKQQAKVAGSLGFRVVP